VNTGRVYLTHSSTPPHELLDEPHVFAELPVADESLGVPALYVNVETKEVFYKYSTRPQSMEEKIEELDTLKKDVNVINMRMLSAGLFYKAMDKESSSIEEVRMAKYNALKEQCDEHILADFYSPSTDAQYGFSEIDQMNMTQQMILFFINPGPIMWKTEDKGLIQLTKEQFIGVAFEAQRHKEKQIKHWWQLKANVIAAQTKEEIMEFEWEGTIL